MRRTFPPPQYKRSEEMWRSYLATFGFSTKQQTSPIGLMSDGQRSRLIFAMLAMQTSGVLLLDEPTNHLDWEAIDWLADHLTDPRRARQLSLLLVTHDRYFLERTCGEILELDNGAVHSYKTDGSCIAT